MAGRGKAAAAARAWIVFEDELGCVLRPPHAKTWGRRGRTPIVTVCGCGSGRVNIAGLTCYRPGHRSRLFYRLLVYHGRKNEKKGFGWQDYPDLLVAAHRQLGAPLIVIWDKARIHWMPGIKEFAAEARLADPGGAAQVRPGVNPTKGIWSLIKRGPLANLVPVGLDEVAGTVRFALKRIQ